jgi:hypothetical protein
LFSVLLLSLSLQADSAAPTSQSAPHAKHRKRYRRQLEGASKCLKLAKQARSELRDLEKRLLRMKRLPHKIPNERIRARSTWGRYIKWHLSMAACMDKYFPEPKH